MRIMGLDVGSKTIGVAVSDPFGWTAQGITTISRQGIEKDVQTLKKLIDEYEVIELLIGLPLNMNGSKGPSAEMAMDFGSLLAERFGIKVSYWDERLSTSAMQRVLIEGDISRQKRRQVIDKMASMYILQGFLDSKK